MFNQNPDFYPTPTILIHKMLNKINWRGLKSILEPSAGRGDLVEAITKRFQSSQYHHRKEKYDVDLIELDENLQLLLKGKGHRLIHDNFLNFSTYKRYDAIIANFPFSTGEHHLKKAIEMQEATGSQLVCIVNAETLRNPYTNVRKEIIQKLEKYNAEVEFIENAFVNSERSTNVSVALIYISFPEIKHNSLVVDELRKEESYKVKEDHHCQSLINSDFITGIVEQYNYEVKAGLKLIEEYNSLKPFMLRSFKDDDRPVLKLELEYEDKDGSNLENAYIKQIRSKYWKALFNNDQFMGLFTSNLKQKYMQHVEELKEYDFSFYNIYSLRIELSKEMVQGVEDTILNLFEEFSYKHYYDESSKNIHMYNGWKTNKAYKINKKVIIPLNGFNSWWSNRYEPTSYQVKDKLKDIEKVFNYLDDGQTEDIDLEETLKFAEHYGETKKIDTKYFLVTFYKKGTTHIEFKNMNLLKKFNLFAGKSKMWLPPSYGEAKYNDMTAEEKAVINDFEGEKSYNDVMKNKSYFIMKTEELLKLTS
jgi:phospholipid N-methyltransferase